MKYLSDEEIRNYLFQYSKSDSYPHAIMLNGPWGSGKSFFIKRVMEHASNALYKSNIKTKTPAPTTKKWIYLSMYGINSIKGFWDNLYAKLLEDKTNGLSSGKIGSLAKLGASVILRYCDVDKTDIKDAKSALAIIEDVFVNPNDCVIVLDDFERCSISMEDRLGVISTLLEDMSAKVIVISNEEEINDDRDSYLKNKEKVIGNTIQYHSGMYSKICNILSSKRYKILKPYESIIYNCVKLKDISNLRHVEYCFEIFFQINNAIKGAISIEQYENKIEHEILQNVLTIGIHYKLGGPRRSWGEKTLFELTADYKKEDDARFNNNIIMAFKFIETFIYESYLDIDEIKETLERYCVYLNDSAQRNDPINKLCYVLTLSDDVVEKQCNVLMKNLKKGKYSLDDYQSILSLIDWISSIGFTTISLDDVSGTILENMQEGKYSATNISVQKYEFRKSKNTYEDILKKIEEHKLKIKEKESIENKTNEILVNDEPINKVAQCLKDIAYQCKGGIFKNINIDYFGTYISKSNEERLYYISELIQHLYHVGNVRELYSNDIPSLELLKSILVNLEAVEKGKIKKYNLNLIINSVESIIKRLQ